MYWLYTNSKSASAPGLINAYKTASALALQLKPIMQKQIEVNYLLEFDYTIMNTVMTIIKQFNCTILQQEMQLFCNMKIGIPKNRESEVLYSLKELNGVHVKSV